jgi:nucleotide-binding universal stress UspA family protein
VLGLTFGCGAAALAFGMEAVLGAFVAGMLLGQTGRLPESARQKIAGITLGVFAPIFFATAGLRVNLGDLLDVRLMAIAVLVILIASIGKLTGGYLGARMVGRNSSRSLVYGIGINARGSQEIIIATIGLSAGILSRSMYTMIILMAITTSLATPAALRWALKYVKPNKRELERMNRERIVRESLVAGIHRVLIPVRRREEINHGAISIYTYLLSRIRRKMGVSATLLNVSPPIEKTGSAQYLKRLSEYFPSSELHTRVLEGEDPAQLILDEAHKDYDLIILGVQDKQTSTSVLFNPLVDYLMRNSPCPTLLVKAESLHSPWRPRRILLPTNGLPAAKNAAEMGFAMASEDSLAVVLHVIPRTQEGEILDIKGVSFERQIASAYEMVREMCNLGEAYGVQTEPRVKIGHDPAMEILKTAQELDVDMILLGTHLRSLSDRLLLGSRVERILEHATCPVLILNSL